MTTQRDDFHMRIDIVFVLLLLISFESSLAESNENYTLINFTFEDHKSFAGWDNCGKVKWHQDCTDSHRGRCSYGSSKFTGKGTSCASRTINGPAYIDFWWKTIPVPKCHPDAPDEGSQFSILIDGNRTNQTDSSEWQHVQDIFLDESRPYDLTWVLEKYESPAGSIGIGLIDDLNIYYQNLPLPVSSANLNAERLLFMPEHMCRATQFCLYLWVKSPKSISHAKVKIEKPGCFKEVSYSGTGIFEGAEAFQDGYFSSPQREASAGGLMINYSILSSSNNNTTYFINVTELNLTTMSGEKIIAAPISGKLTVDDSVDRDYFFSFEEAAYDPEIWRESGCRICYENMVDNLRDCT